MKIVKLVAEYKAAPSAGDKIKANEEAPYTNELKREILPLLTSSWTEAV